ncbi:hypothetical protein [Lentzea sp. NBRC 102530]|uniref:hypothetical protein n=1 Tax=Lentzea sp. NBRC 102530 TaxID=3032201 RepID=UPI0024A20584|nr:hypothetical protein [Lentzea sp. NBRC 102530]GLY52614.1 hypothetical protein Lesp01_62700 [Lentzea sp. NBRC 102530]
MSEFWSDLTPWETELTNLKSAGGGWAINDSGGDALINAANELYDALSDLAFQADQLTEELPLGTTPAAQVYKPFIATVASDPVQGATTVLKKLQQEALEFRNEVQKAMDAYEATDRGSALDLKQAGPHS